MDLHREKLERILGWFKGEISFPFKAVFIPTNRCNLNCPYCPCALPRWEGKFKVEEELLDKEWKRVVKECVKLGIREYSIIGGGEPFLRKRAVLSLVEKIKRHKYTDCEIITNGSLLNESDVKKLVRFGLDRILFSIDAPYGEVHDSLRGVKGTFERVTNNVRAFAELKRRLRSDKPYLKINMVLNRKNFRLVEEMVKFVQKIGGQELALHPMRKYFDSMELEEFSLKKDEEPLLEKEIEKAKIIAEKLKIFLNTEMVKMESAVKNKVKRKKSRLEEKIEKCYCFEPLYAMLIDAKGFVGGCSPAGSGIKSLNVKEKSLKEIWFSEELSQMRKFVLDGKKFDYCLKCGLTDMKIHIRRDLIGYLNA